MIEPLLYIFLSVALVSVVSLVGVLAISLNLELLKKLVTYLISFAAGGLLGDAFIHLLPEIVQETGFNLRVSMFILVGIGFSFIIEKIIHWRHCHVPTSENHPHPFALMNLLGDSVHNFIDGMIIATAYLVSIPVGLATTVAVILHEIPQEIGDFGVLIHGGFSRGRALFLNFATALTAILGAIIAVGLNAYVENITSFLIPFTAGTFIYIAGADLIPELHKEVSVRKSFIQLLFFVTGIGLMTLMLLIE